jgi:predicted AlkP superfamily phosphohydrolase/phosphomutase
MTASNPPLILFSMDGGDDRLIQSWVEAGYLPAIANLMEKGSWGKLTGSEHLAEHGTSLSLISGISRSIHGYYYFRQLVPKTYTLKPFNFADTGISPFWSCLKASNKKVAVIDAPDSVIVSDLKGIQLANWAIHEAALTVLPPCANPPELLQETRKIFGKQIPVSEFKPDASFADDVQMYQTFLHRIEKKGQLFRELCLRDHFDLIAIGFYESHTAAHRFWQYRKEIHAEENQLTNAIRDIYQAIDRELGLLLKELPQDANIVMFSAFGMEDSYPTTGLISSFCQELGYQILHPAPANLALNPLSLARCFIPQSWRKAISHHFSLSLQERLLTDSFSNSTHWEKTRAFAIPSLYTSFIRVNLQGREPQGIVKPGKEYQELLIQIERDLQQLIDPVTNKPAIKRVVRTVDLFSCDPPEILPDIFIEWQPARHFMERLIHPQTQLSQSKSTYHRNSYHSMNGFMAAAGNSIVPKGNIGDISLLDLAPTFLGLIGENIPENLKGKVINF